MRSALLFPLSRTRLPLVLLAGMIVLGGTAGCGPRSAPPSPAVSAPAPPRYRITDLGPGYSATDLNDKGQVVGYGPYSKAKGLPVALWENGRWRPLGNCGKGQTGFDFRLNNRGAVTAFIGDNVSDGWSLHAAVLRAGNVSSLGTRSPTDYSFARDMNDSGQIVGASGSAVGGAGNRALLWEKQRPPRDLAGPKAHFLCEAEAINDSGDVAGVFSQELSVIDRVMGRRFPASHAFLWSQGKMTDLGTLTGDRESKATDINSKKEIVGVSGSLTGCPFHGFIWSAGRMRPLPPLSGHNTSYVHAINDSGQAVGYSLSRSSRGTLPGSRAVLWQNDQAYDLNTLVTGGSKPLGWARAINRQGQILVLGSAKGKERYCLLTPI